MKFVLLCFCVIFGKFFPIDAELATNPSATTCTVVIFGATGDLTARKLVPALFNLAERLDVENLKIVGVGRREYSSDVFRKQMYEALQKSFNSISSTRWNHFQHRLHYHQADFTQDDGYERLKELLAQLEGKEKGNRIYYLATESQYFLPIIKKLHQHQLIYNPDCKTHLWSRVIIEKPFGSDLKSAEQLQNHILKYLDESQIYRMDHYLGKEGVQNLIKWRFENSFFEALWNRQNIENVQITISEDIGIGDRGHFWEETGFLRDIFQNHLMQLLALVAMEPPVNLTAELVHREKVKVLNRIRPIAIHEMDQQVIRGQYKSGMIHGKPVIGYRDEKNVAKTSLVETFVTAKLFIDNERWQGVPFYLRGGKRLPLQTAEIVITFKKTDSSQEQKPDRLFIRIQPNAGIFSQMHFEGGADKLQSLVLENQKTHALPKEMPEAYEKLLYDSIQGNQTFFVQYEELLAAWRIWTPVLDYWKTQPPEAILNYEAGTWGPGRELTQWNLLESARN